MRLALFQPDIPQNTGTLLRLGACLDVPLDIIEPCGFVFSERTLKRSGMDYLHLADYRRHNSWNDFLQYRAEHPDEYGRIVLLTTHASRPYTEYFIPFAPSVNTSSAPYAFNNVRRSILMVSGRVSTA